MLVVTLTTEPAVIGGTLWPSSLLNVRSACPTLETVILPTVVPFTLNSNCLPTSARTCSTSTWNSLCPGCDWYWELPAACGNAWRTFS